MTQGAQIQTREAFLYGRFETLMKPAYGSGIVSSFFTFNDVDFQLNWNEIDFEFLGRNTNLIDTNLIRTFLGITNKNINVKYTTLNKRSESAFWKLCIEWTPDIIRWKINDVIIRSEMASLRVPQKLMMNIWQGSPEWAGEFNGGILPQKATYKYVKYSRYENDQFVPAWMDRFTELNEERWYVALHNTGLTQLVKENVAIVNNNLVLNLTSIDKTTLKP